MLCLSASLGWSKNEIIEQREWNTRCFGCVFLKSWSSASNALSLSSSALSFSTRVVLHVVLCGQDYQAGRKGGGAEWRGGGQEAEGRRGRRKALVKLDLCEAFLPWYKSNNRGSGVRFSAFFYEWSLPPAKTTYSPRSDSFFFFLLLLRGSLKTSVEHRGLLVIIFVFLTFPFPFLVLLAEKRAGEDFHSPLS